jgi:hypothetical protein
VGRRIHLTRTMLGVLVAIAFWLAVIAGLIELASRPRVRAWAARELSRRLAAVVGQPIKIADLKMTLLPPRLAVIGLELGPPGALLVRADAVEVGLSQLRLAERELVLSQLRLRGVHVSGTVPSTSPEGRQPWLRLVVRQLLVEGLEIEHLSIPGGVVVSAEDVDARWTGTPRRPISAAVVRAGRVVVRAPGVAPIEAAINAWGKRTDNGWVIGRAHGVGPWWEVDLRGDVVDRTVTVHGRVRCDLARLDEALHISASLTGKAEAQVQATIKAPDFRVDAQITAARAGVVMFSFGDVRGDAHVSREGIEASLAHATFAGGVVEGSYALSGLGPPWSHHAAARGEGVELADFLTTLGVPPAGLAGRASFTANVAWDGMAIKQGAGTGVAELTAHPGDVPANGQVVVSLAGDGALAISTTDTVLAGAPVHWEGRLTLGSWLPSWVVQGERVPVPVIARLLRGWVGTDVLPSQLGGEAALDLRLRGPFQDLSVVGDVAVAPLSYASVSADGLQGLLRVGGGKAVLEGGQILLGKGRVACDGSLDYQHDLALDLRASGRGVPLEKLAAWGGLQAPLSGKVDFTGRLGGTIDRPSADAALQLAEVTLAGVPFGSGTGSLALADGVVSLHDFRVGPFAATVAVDVLRREARVDASLAGFGLDAISPPLGRLLGGALDCTFHGAFPFDSPSGRLEVASAGGAKGHVELDREGIVIDVARPQVWRLSGHLRQQAGSYGGRLEFGVSSWRQATHDLLGGDLPIDGELSGHAEVTLARGQPARVTGAVDTLALQVEDERATLQAPAQFTVEGSAVALAGARVLGPHSSLFVRGARHADGTLTGNVAGEFPAVLLALFFRGGNPHGHVELLGELLGTDKQPRFEGVARVDQGALTVPGLPGPLTGIQGVFEIVPEVIALSGVKFQLSGGEGTCDGRLILSPAFELDLTTHASHVRWPLPWGFTPSLQGEVRIVGPLDNLSVTGETALQRTVYRRELSLQKLVVEGLTMPVRNAQEEGAVNLNVHVSVPSTLEVAMPLAHLSARGDVRLVGTSARPGVLGRIEVLPGGEAEMNGVRYEIDRATVTFTDPARIEPFLDVSGHTTVQNWDITVTLIGTLERLTPTFSSIPPLPEMDIVALLSVGKRVEEVGQVQAGAAASSFLTEQLTGAVTNRARSLLALDQLSVDPVATSQTGNPTARLTVAKQLSRDWIVTVSTTLASNREEVIVSRWRLAQGLYLEATRDTDGSYALDVKWQRRY